MKKISVCLSIFVSISLIGMEEIASFKKYPEQINQPSIALAYASYKAWKEHGEKMRHRIPFAYEAFEEQGKNNCFSKTST